MDKVPKHVAIIMDGNRRWAKKNNFPKTIGHRSGVLKIKDCIEVALDLDIKNLTVYAFSTENWGRDNEEVSFLMNLMIEFIKNELKELHSKDIKLNIFGIKDNLPKKVCVEINKAIELTKDNKTLNLNVALNYGARNEIIFAIKQFAKEYKNGSIELDSLTEDSFKQYLFTKDIPDPDLLIRTSGEIRVSNFLLYQLAYTEFYFTDVLWPEFTKEEFLKAILNYQNRSRRFGKL